MAVIAVIVQHAPVRWPGLAGWTGVDLFFVLSGFLVSGVLFSEHKTHGSIHIGRFLIRRGFKIYPGFYCLIAARILISLTQGHRTSASHWLPEVLFIQNYLPGLWVHTWSLAVEEHFYLLLAIALLVMAKRRGSDPFRAIPALFGIVAVLALGARIATIVMFEPRFAQVLEPTHLRLDSLFCGVALSFFFHYRHASIERWAARPYLPARDRRSERRLSPARPADSRLEPAGAHDRADVSLRGIRGRAAARAARRRKTIAGARDRAPVGWAGINRPVFLFNLRLAYRRARLDHRPAVAELSAGSERLDSGQRDRSMSSSASRSAS